MVSFQCHGCGDVVKKPKLDQHRTRCHTGFDCIDCSKTFNTPTDYKGHTSCISEAEKYQKSLYKGPKTNDAPRNNYPPQPPSQYPEGGSWNQSRGRGGFRGGRGGGRGGWGQPQSRGTGANDTPLGTPRMSPFVPSPPGQATPTNVETPAQDGGVAPSSSKDKSKKRKADESVAVNSDGPSNKKAKVVTNGTTVDPASIPLPSSPSPEDRKKEKKKSKKDKDGEGAVNEKGKKKKDKKDVDEAAVTDSKEKKKKKEKRDKKSKGEDRSAGEAQDIEMAAPLENKKKKDKQKEGEVQTSLTTEPATEETGDKSSRKEKKKRDKSEKLETEQVGERVEEKKKKKKKKNSESLSLGDIDTNSIPVEKVEQKEKKSKKEKRKQADAVSAS